MSPKQRKETLARLESLRAFMASRTKAPASVPNAPKAPRRAPRRAASVPAKATRAPRRAASVPAKATRAPRVKRPVFGPVLRPVGYVQPQDAQVLAKKLKRAQEKQTQNAQLRAKSWNAMSPARRQELQRISAMNLGEFNRIMDAQANQFEMRQASERLASERLAKQIAQSKAKRAQEKQAQHAQLRLRAYNAASADKKKLIDLLGKQSGDLSAYNKLMNALAQQQEQRQIAQRKALYEAKSAVQKAELDKITDPVLYDKKLREKRLTFSEQIAQKAKKRAQKAQTEKALALMKPQGPRPGQKMQDFKLRMSRQAAQARMAPPVAPSLQVAIWGPRQARSDRLPTYEQAVGPRQARSDRLPTYEQAVRAPVVHKGGFWF